jgi:hypothetical protein
MRRALNLLTAMAVLSGCGDGEGGSSPYIRATIAGQTWAAEAQEGQVAYSVDHPDGGWIYTIASRKVGKGSQFFTVTVPLPPAPGSFPLDGVVTSATFASCPDDILADCIFSSAIAAHPGTLTIDQVDPATGLIEGDFNFTGYALGSPEGTATAVTGGHFRFYAPSVFILE